MLAKPDSATGYVASPLLAGGRLLVNLGGFLHGLDPLTGTVLRASHGHGDYFNPGSESVRNIAAVTIGAADLATYGAMSARGDHVLDGWRLIND